MISFKIFFIQTLEIDFADRYEVLCWDLKEGIKNSRARKLCEVSVWVSFFCSVTVAQAILESLFYTVQFSQSAKVKISIFLFQFGIAEDQPSMFLE